MCGLFFYLGVVIADPRQKKVNFKMTITRWSSLFELLLIAFVFLRDDISFNRFAIFWMVVVGNSLIVMLGLLDSKVELVEKFFDQFAKKIAGISHGKNIQLFK